MTICKNNIKTKVSRHRVNASGYRLFRITSCTVLVIAALISTCCTAAFADVLSLGTGLAQQIDVQNRYPNNNSERFYIVMLNGVNTEAHSTNPGSSISNSVIKVTAVDANTISVYGISSGSATITIYLYSRVYSGSALSYQSNTLTYRVTVERSSYTINYYANGGTGAPSPQSKTPGSPITLRTGTPTKDGYIFLGWANSSYAATPVYQPGDTYNTDRDLSLFAVWEFDHYVIKYDANGGIGTPESQNKNAGSSVTLSSTIPEKAGYTFKGWAENPTATVADYSPAAVFSEDRFVTLYAVWEMVPIQSVSLSKTTCSIYEFNQDELTATVSPSDTPMDKTLTWTSSDVGVATVDSGVISAVKAGSCIITASAVNGIQDTCRVTVLHDTSRTVPITEEFFPDVNFRSYISNNIDSDGNGFLGDSEISGTNTIAISRMSVSSLEGIQYFPEITYLVCMGNPITTLDVSKNTNLETLTCNSCNITTLNILGCTRLKELYCENNQISALNVSNCTRLADIVCSNNNLTTFNASKLSNLVSLAISNNPVSTLNINSSVLHALYCRDTDVDSLDIRNCPQLLKAYLFGSPMDYSSRGYTIYSYEEGTSYADYQYFIIDVPIGTTFTVNTSSVFSNPDLKMPSNLKSIESNAFEGINAFVVDIPSTCTSIGDYAFQDSAVKVIRIPDNCVLGTDVFNGCNDVLVFGSAGSAAESYCAHWSHWNCRFHAG